MDCCQRVWPESPEHKAWWCSRTTTPKRVRPSIPFDVYFDDQFPCYAVNVAFAERREQSLFAEPVQHACSYLEYYRRPCDSEPEEDDGDDGQYPAYASTPFPDLLAQQRFWLGRTHGVVRCQRGRQHGRIDRGRCGCGRWDGDAARQENGQLFGTPWWWELAVW